MKAMILAIIAIAQFSAVVAQQSAYDEGVQVGRKRALTLSLSLSQ